MAVLRPRRLLVCVMPLLAALAWLVASNWVGNGIVAVSPYGSVFALARLQADGPAADYLRSVCPEAGYRVCAWADELPMDSDAFLWRPDGPMWAGGYGPTRVAPEASRIVVAALRYEPGLAALRAAINTLRQLGLDEVGDTLGPQHLTVTVGKLLSLYFPLFEIRWFLASRQVDGTLPALAAPLLPLHRVMLWLGAAGTVVLLCAGWRRFPVITGLAAMVLAGVLANAFATGALSGPHDRYGARIAWLVLLPPILAAMAGGWRSTRPPAVNGGLKPTLR